jgi:hypothetical protein
LPSSGPVKKAQQHSSFRQVFAKGTGRCRPPFPPFLPFYMPRFPLIPILNPENPARPGGYSGSSVHPSRQGMKYFFINALKYKAKSINFELQSAFNVTYPSLVMREALPGNHF